MMPAYLPGDIVGPVDIIKLIDQTSARLENWTYLIRWRCCGREEIQKHKAIRKRALPPYPLSCVQCGRKRSLLSRPSEPRRKKPPLMHAAPVIVAAAGWYWPSLTPEGPRPPESRATYYESESP